MEIAVYTIAKNEAKNVQRFMASCGPAAPAGDKADGVFVLDTGSTDDTAQLLRDAGAIVITETVDPWRFDAATQQAPRREVGMPQLILGVAEGLAILLRRSVEA